MLTVNMRTLQFSRFEAAFVPVTGSVDTRSSKGPELRVLKSSECLFTTTLVAHCGTEGCSAAEKFLEKLEALATSLELEPASRAYRSLVLVP